MKSAGKIKKLFARANITVHSEFDDKVINTALSELGEAGKENFTPDVPMKFTKNPIIRFATAALIIIAAILVITFSQKQTSTAYAIDQTLEAMGQASTMHCSMNFFTGEQFEVWIEVDPQTGEFNKIVLDSPDIMKVSTIDGTYKYYKNTNKLDYLKENIYFISEIIFGPLMNDMVAWTDSDNNSKMSIIEGEDSVTIATLEKDESTIEWKVDSETKLPISMRVTSKSMNMISKDDLEPIQIELSLNDFSYDSPLPEEFSNFQIPEEVKKGNK